VPGRVEGTEAPAERRSWSDRGGNRGSHR